ncbi:MAG: hypothetical protein CBC29_06070 [Methylococcaceae bacterium TMED69]|mgnify:CR=1 FL=1|nr:MAG: hypothetical protein CBC29_06070 [Methylococcaceae bacterium TMED69]|tara:strand:- start:781 stop:1224 length:444 start_codon:yes stop_codon:yes gene_type:complete
MSILTRYNKDNNFLSTFDEMVRDFDSVFMPLSYHSSPKKIDSTPRANVIKSENGYDIELAAPGFSRDEFNMNVENGVLSISVSTEDGVDHRKNLRRREWSYSSWTRSFTLPETTNVEAIAARYDAGILYINIPVSSEKETRRVITID